MLSLNSFDLFGLAPLVVVTLTAIGVLLLGAFTRGARRDYLGYTAIGGLALAAIFSWLFWSGGMTPHNGYVFRQMMIVDDFALFFNFLIAGGAAATMLMSFRYLEEHGINYGEFFALLLFAVVGMMMLAGATDMLIVFLGVETMSIPVYVMAGMMRARPKSVEGAFKYFILGAFASGFLLYGIALLYAGTGATSFAAIAGALKGLENPLTGNPAAFMGMLLILVGLGFKIALVPFHMWTPDVYEGAPSFITGFMATAVKAAGFAVLIRVLMVVFGDAVTGQFAVSWQHILPWLALATMTLGNLVALVQKNIKRMLAYSSIAHAGYALVGVCAAAKVQVAAEANTSVLFYLLAYTLMTIGAFAIICYLERREKDHLLVENYAGLAKHYPGLALAMAIFMFSLAGIPPAVGFFGKFYVFKAAVNADLLWLAIAGVINSVVSVYYYLSVSIQMYMKPGEETVPPVRNPALFFVVIAMALLVLYYGIFPSGGWDAAAKGVQALLHLAS